MEGKKAKREGGRRTFLLEEKRSNLKKKKKERKAISYQAVDISITPIHANSPCAH
jgi:hypothetical protein